MYAAPSPAWYACGLRRIARALASAADALDRRVPAPRPLEPAPDWRSVDDRLLEVRSRAQGGV